MGAARLMSLKEKVAQATIWSQEIFMKKAILSAGIVTAVALTAFAGVKSGLPKGAEVAPFHPKTHVAGPLVGSDKCFPCTYKNRPQVQVWVNNDSEANVMAIAQQLDKAMNTHKKAEFKAMIVMLVDPAKLDEKTTKLAEKTKAMKNGNVAIAVLANNHEAVKEYKINLDAKNTVVMYKNWTVTDTMVNFDASKDAKTMDKAIAALVK